MPQIIRFSLLGGMGLKVSCLGNSCVGVGASKGGVKIFPHPPNFTPLIAIALFGGAFFEKKSLAIIIPLTAMLLSDLIIGFHALMPFVYGSFCLITLLGRSLKKQSLERVFAYSVGSSVLFFVVANFGVWFIQGMYPQNISGLVACYAAALPFFKNILLGTLLYFVPLFYGFIWAEKHGQWISLWIKPKEH